MLSPSWVILKNPLRINFASISPSRRMAPTCRGYSSRKEWTVLDVQTVNGDQLRELFLSFFEEKGHLGMPSASLIPVGDPTLLLTSAGMVPFKPYFTGEASPPNLRLTSCQKCFRTSDIDGVGDAKHTTFFEMLGNFSIGDYFKQEAIAWAWEFLSQRLGMPAERLWVTIYTDDDEAFHYWRDDVGVPEERIYRYGRSDNWWGPAGSEGPCGPCSEIHYDFGAQYGCSPMAGPNEAADYETREVGCHPNCTRCERFVELWNLVFMQSYQQPDGSFTDLPKPNIDTGMGLERAAAILQGKTNVYETDLFAPLVAKVTELTGHPYGQNHDTDEAIRVVAEHSRAITFLIADGVVPGNEGRGYVLRRVMRRAIRSGRRLGLQGAFLVEMAQAVIEHMGPAYPELARNREFVLKTLEMEERLFSRRVITGAELVERWIEWREGLRKVEKWLIPELENPDQEITWPKYRGKFVTLVEELGQTLEQLRPTLIVGGRDIIAEVAEPLDRFDQDIRQVANETKWAGRSIGSVEEMRTVAAQLAKQSQKALDAVSREISGAEAFVLHDTYGFPVELTQEIVAEHGLSVDMEGFEREMVAQRERSRAADRFDIDVDRTRAYEALGVGATAFVGYDTTIQPTIVVGLLADGQVVTKVSEGQQVEVVLRETPFYPEGGGQVGDAGEILGDQGLIQVEDTQRPVGDLIVHTGRVTRGAVETGEPVEARVDQDHRLGSARNHTGTHLLHAALRDVLGAHVRQAGSLVAPDRLRFDFTSPVPLTQDELQQVEQLVNRKVREDLAVRKRETSYQAALEEGALAFFGERYADQVRVVEVANGAPFSLEVCGGTHLERTGEVGSFLILSESSIGSGMRRIEALTGRGAEAFVRTRLNALQQTADLLQTTPGDVEARARDLLEELDQARKRAEALERQMARGAAEELLDQIQEVAGTRVIAGRASVSSMEALRETGDWLRDRLGSGIVVLGAVLEGRPTLVAMVTPDLVSKGFDAGGIVREAAKAMDGGGGGRPHLAQAGGRLPEKLDDALASVPQVVASLELPQT